MHALVDLSLFAVSPTNDGHFTLGDEYAHTHVAGSSRQAVNPTHMKPLPPIPNQRTAALKPDHRSPVANPSQCILRRMKKLKIDTTLATGASTLSRPERSEQQTLQQRRRHPQATTPALTIPTRRPVAQDRTASAIEGRKVPPPMIWLADEQMWLVAEALERDRELYGFYAPAPYSDPGPWQDNPPLHGYAVESPPVYSIPSASPPDSSDLSPVRTQFLSLMGSQRRENTQPAAAPASSSSYQVPPIRDDKAMSPLFQQAISGVDYLPSFPQEALEPARPASSERRESTFSEGYVSPLSPPAEFIPPWRMQRTVSAMV